MITLKVISYINTIFEIFTVYCVKTFAFVHLCLKHKFLKTYCFYCTEEINDMYTVFQKTGTLFLRLLCVLLTDLKNI